MKFTKSYLKQIIKEEMQVMEEAAPIDPVTDALQETLALIKSIEWDNQLAQQVTYDYQKAAAKLKQKVQAALATVKK